MKKDIRSCIIRVVKFLGNDYKNILGNEEILQGIVRHSDFSRMSKDQQRWPSARPKDKPEFIRKGEVGDWRNHLSDDQSRRMDEKFALLGKILYRLKIIALKILS